MKVSGKPSGHYMDRDDNPPRPRAHFWFGPMSMIDFLGCYNLTGTYSNTRYDWMPGTAREAPMYACKLGIQAALLDIENNHPNDQVSLIFYSRPRSSSSDTANRFNRVRVPLGRRYDLMKEALFFPPSTLGNFDPLDPPRPFDSDNIEVPRPSGGTCYSMGLMLAFNQFSAEPTLRTYNAGASLSGDAGGLGRRGAYKLIILETDGLPNTTASAGFVSAKGPSGENRSYYRVRYNSANPGGSQFPSVASSSDNSSAVTTQIYDVASQICSLETASIPGFSTSRKPVKIHCIGFGPIFETSSSARTSALTTLQQIERIGKAQSTSTPTAWLPDYKIVTGDDDAIIAKLRTAIINIMQDGVQVSLIY